MDERREERHERGRDMPIEEELAGKCGRGRRLRDSVGTEDQMVEGTGWDYHRRGHGGVA